MGMRDEPSGAALLDAARRSLMDEVVPGLAGRPRYVALMVANALGIAAREIGEAHGLEAAHTRMIGGSDPSSDALAALARAIRDGRRDADADLHAALTAAADVAARVWKPSAPGG